MSNFQLKTPVAFIIFKRPETTLRVFETIRQVKPPQLLVVADGPRPDREGEAELCAQTRSIIEEVDWNCEVLKNYSPENLGCKKRVSSGLNWVFDTVEEAIILEDDCLPDMTFYPFAEELLDRYRHDHRVFSITGQNVQFGRKRHEYSYYFSRYSHCWTWASWRRAWKYYDVDMKLWPEIRDGHLLNDILGDTLTVNVWKKTFEMCYNGILNTWDFQWTFANFVQHALTAVSDVNLVKNIGYGSGGTHTGDLDSPYNNMLTEPLELPLKHPPFMIRDAQRDQFTQKTLYDYVSPLHKRLFQRIKKISSRLKNSL